MLCGTLARELGGDACFISIFLLHAATATLFPGSDVEGNRRLLQAGQTAVLNCSALVGESWLQNKQKIYKGS